jgi:hypothetical protein
MSGSTPLARQTKVPAREQELVADRKLGPMRGSSSSPKRSAPAGAVTVTSYHPTRHYRAALLKSSANLEPADRASQPARKLALVERILRVLVVFISLPSYNDRY